jgi:hypothetical protein
MRVKIRRREPYTVALRDKFLRIQTEADEQLDRGRDAAIDVGGRNALARLLGASGPYLGRVLSGEMGVSEEMLARFRQRRERA